MAFILPPRNLPPLSSDWGRSVEDSLADNLQTRNELSSSVNNYLRATGGQLSVISNKIEELKTRSTQSVSVPNITVTAPSGGAPSPAGTQSFSFPPTTETRAARIEVVGRYQRLSDTSEFSYLSRNSEILTKSPLITYFQEEFSTLSAYVVIPGGSTPNFSITYRVISFVGSQTSTLSGITAYLTWGNPIT